MRRFFSFGCSFTSYIWPTWADIIAKQFPYHENWGRAGSGNFYIFNSVIECITRNKVSKDDIIAIMWTSTSREDRYVGNQWIGQGNIYNQNIYDETFVKQFSDDRGYLLRDLNIISAIKSVLDHIGVEYYFLSMMPIGKNELDENETSLKNLGVLELYKDTVSIIRPSVYETIFNNDWFFEDRIDIHPTPPEFLKYLDHVLPEIAIQEDTRSWINEIDTIIRNKQSLKTHWTPRFPERF